MKAPTTRPPSRLRSAFTLMEMIFVLAIISVLVGMGIYALQNVVGDADITRARADVRTLSMNLVRYRTQSMALPTQEQGLRAMVENPGNVKNWRSLMTEAALNDPWGNPYQYESPGSRSAEAYDVFSMGADGTPNTDDDIGNW